MGSHQVHFTGADYYALVSIVIGTVTALDILFHRGSTFRLVRQNKWLWFLGCAATYVIVLSPFFTLAYILFCHHKMVQRRGPRPARGGRGGGYGLPESGTSRPGYGSDWMNDMSRTCSSCGGRKTQRCIGCRNGMVPNPNSGPAEVPHFTCGGRGEVTCTSCGGRGTV